MGPEKNESPVATAANKIIVSPARHAATYARETWQRLTKADGKKNGGRPVHISTPVIIPNAADNRRLMGIASARTRLRRSASDVDASGFGFSIGYEDDDGDDDEEDDDDSAVRLVPSRVPSDRTNAATSYAYVSSQPSPAILDSQWRRFADTPVKSSPSYFLGSWAHGSDSQGTITRGDNDEEDEDDDEAAGGLSPSSHGMIESMKGEIDAQLASWKKLSREEAAAKAAASEYIATPPVGHRHHRNDYSFLHRREDFPTARAGPSIGHNNNVVDDGASSRFSVATPTPAVRYAPQHQRTGAVHQIQAPQQHYNPGERRIVSDSVVGASTCDMDEWMTEPGTIDGREYDADVGGPDDRFADVGGPGRFGSDLANNFANNNVSRDRWSFVSVRGQSSTTDNLVVHYHSEDDDQDEGVNNGNNTPTIMNRRKVSFADEPRPATAIAAVGIPTARGAHPRTPAPAKSNMKSSSPPSRTIHIRRQGEQNENGQIQQINTPQQEQTEATPSSANARTHPRYSGTFNVDVNRRRMSTHYGPAVFMDS
ncbi:hypothetical protein KJ359_002755 [Pestalotiopsis sp. 9143b]|nr:hypothetical protein KJ359_002755 [Pestalotiopsis sp. 9143b]